MECAGVVKEVSGLGASNPSADASYESILTGRSSGPRLGKASAAATEPVSEGMRCEAEAAGRVSARGDRGERTPKNGVEGSAAPREEGSCRPVGKEERAGRRGARLLDGHETGRRNIFVLPQFVSKPTKGGASCGLDWRRRWHSPQLAWHLP